MCDLEPECGPDGGDFIPGRCRAAGLSAIAVRFPSLITSATTDINWMQEPVPVRARAGGICDRTFSRIVFCSHGVEHGRAQGRPPVGRSASGDPATTVPGADVLIPKRKATNMLLYMFVI